VGGPDELLALAEIALVHAKTSGGDATFRYSAELDGDDGELEVDDDRGLGRLRALARELDAEDPGTEGHSERVSRLSEKLALSCGWNADLAIRLAQAALLHDVGKLGIGEAVLGKPGKLSASELEQIRNHPDTGAEIAVKALDEEQLGWIRHHHERWDGAGYPNGVAGEAIPAGGRLLALAEAWDSMTSSRVYGDALSAADALAECKRERGCSSLPRPSTHSNGSGRSERSTRRTSAAPPPTTPASRPRGSASGRPRQRGPPARPRLASARSSRWRRTLRPERDDAVVVADRFQPACLVHHDGVPTEESIQLAAIGHLDEQPEQIPRLRTADAERQQRALPRRGQIGRPGEPARSQAVVYLPRPNAGWLSTRIESA
jgi:putative nucleotidyltransferase with HDIG domain